MTDTEIQKKIDTVIETAMDKQAKDIMSLKVGDIITFTQYFILCHGTSTRHVEAINEDIIDTLKEEGFDPYGVEGEENAEWILIDLSDVVVHIFTEEKRQFYDLEGLWGEVETKHFEDAKETG